jgi:hypothetical protein
MKNNNQIKAEEKLVSYVASKELSWVVSIGVWKGRQASRFPLRNHHFLYGI